MGSRKLSRFSPSRTILISVFITIITGTLLLGTPYARTAYVSWLDLFFTATSVTCVTGLFTVPIQTTFTRFGHTILMCLMQIGALGLITMTLFFMALFMRFGISTQFMAGQLLEIERLRNIRRLILSIVVIAITTEAIGAIFMYSSIRHLYPPGDAWFYSIFQAVASFCNAPGVTLLKDGIIPPTNAILLLRAALSQY